MGQTDPLLIISRQPTIRLTDSVEIGIVTEHLAEELRDLIVNARAGDRDAITTLCQAANGKTPTYGILLDYDLLVVVVFGLANFSSEELQQLAADHL